MASRRRLKLLDAGVQAPDFRLPLLDGGEATRGEIAARGQALIVFFKITCPVCQMTLPFLDRISKPGTLPIYGVSQNDPEDTREFNQEFGVTFPVMLDSEQEGFAVSNAFGISTVPTCFLLEADGRISRVSEGWSKREIEWLGNRANVSPFQEGENVPEWKAG